MKDYYKIGEISKIYGIGPDSLRYYEEIGVLKPLRDDNGYRMYSMQDIWRLNVIKDLRNLDFSMKKIKEYLDNRTLESTKQMLNDQIKLLEKKIDELKRSQKSMSYRLKSIDDISRFSKFNIIEVTFIESRKVLQLNGKVSRDEEVDFLIRKLQKEYEDRLYLFGNKNIGAVLSMEQVKNNIYNQYESVFFLLDSDDPNYNMMLNEGYYITLTYKGSYEQSRAFIPQMIEFIEDSGYEILSSPIEIYKIDIHETSCIEEFVTQIQIPVILG